MKKLLLALALAFSITTVANAAEEKAEYTYEGSITGVVCSACKEHVTAALSQKLPGFVSLNIKNTDSPESKKLTVVASNPAVTKEAVTEALGTYAKNYKILSLEKKN